MGALLSSSPREKSVNKIVRHGKWFSIVTRVGDKFEKAIVPFDVVAVDGGPGFERDSLLLTAFYNEKDSPMQLAIFGPEGNFGHSILSGDIAIARK